MMSLAGAPIITSLAVFRGELQKLLLAFGVVLFIMFIAWAIEEWRMRKTGAAMSWLGVACLGLVGFGAAALMAVGLL